MGVAGAPASAPPLPATALEPAAAAEPAAADEPAAPGTLAAPAALVDVPAAPELGLPALAMALLTRPAEAVVFTGGDADADIPAMPVVDPIDTP